MSEAGQNPAEVLAYQRCRFSTEIPCDRVYTRDHYWIKEETPGVWRVGLTPWAIRMLEDFVECGFEVAEGAAVEIDQPLGTLEAFKAATEIRAVATGTFIGANPILERSLDVITLDCYDAGWLYMIRGMPGADVRTASQYTTLLDETIDVMRKLRPKDCP
jgi:glycine cleavage system H protein